MRRVHVGLHLEHKRTEGLFQRARLLVDIQTRRWRGEQVNDGVEQQPYPKICKRASYKHRSGFSRQKRLDVQIGTHCVEQTTIVHGLRPRHTLTGGGLFGRQQFLRRLGGTASHPGELHIVPGAAINHAPEVAGDAHRPGDRGRPETDLLLHLIEQFQRLTAGTVELVEERDDRQVAATTHLEQLQCLWLHALGHVEHHDHRVHGRQYSIRVLREISVTGRVEQVEHVTSVRELQHGGTDGNTALLLQLHPVRRSRATTTTSLHRPGLLQGAAVEKELFREGGLAGIGMADDGERASSGRLHQDVVL